eukprot:SAG31_NODE_28839_length_404_cov_1.183607_1_plen_41_part_01
MLFHLLAAVLQAISMVRQLFPNVPERDTRCTGQIIQVCPSD